MQWRKCGLIYAPEEGFSWAKSHAMVPTPLLMGDDRIRLYITCCDENMVGRVGYIDVDAKDPHQIFDIAREPVLDIGAPGAFDDSGVIASSVVRVDDELRMYYMGFQRWNRVPYSIFTGLAVVSQDVV